jgi:hypothetical protein
VFDAEQCTHNSVMSRLIAKVIAQASKEGEAASAGQKLISRVLDSAGSEESAKRILSACYVPTENGCTQDQAREFVKLCATRQTLHKGSRAVHETLRNDASPAAMPRAAHSISLDAFSEICRIYASPDPVLERSRSVSFSPAKEARRETNANVSAELSKSGAQKRLAVDGNEGGTRPKRRLQRTGSGSMILNVGFEQPSGDASRKRMKVSTDTTSSISTEKLSSSSTSDPLRWRTTQTRVAGKLMVHAGLRCACHYQLSSACPNRICTDPVA